MTAPLVGGPAVQGGESVDQSRCALWLDMLHGGSSQLQTHLDRKLIYQSVDIKLIAGQLGHGHTDRKLVLPATAAARQPGVATNAGWRTE